MHLAVNCNGCPLAHRYWRPCCSRASGGTRAARGAGLRDCRRLRIRKAGSA